MGYLASPDALLRRWTEMERDPSLQDLPYKIELNSWGKVEMSPAGVRHGWVQAELAAQFKLQLRDGATITECPILTDIGIRVPDLAEITEKTRAYLAAGAEEVCWLTRTGAFALSIAPAKKPRAPSLSA